MQINDAFQRIVAGHAKLLAVFVVLPVLVIALLSLGHQTDYVASARIQASSSTNGSDTEADSVLNRVKGVATSTAVVGQAINAAHITGRSPVKVAAEVNVTRLGSSTVLDISVTDQRQNVATALATALAAQVVDFLTGPGSVRSGPLTDQLAASQQSLYAQRKALVASLAGARSTTQSAELTAELSTLDQQLADLSSTLRQLQVAAVTDSSATVISGAAPAKPTASKTNLDLVLAAFAGAVLGLIVASVLEVIRPRVSNARAYSRELDVPLLGRLDLARPHAVRTVLRHASAHANLHTLVLVSDSTADRLADVARVLTGDDDDAVPVPAASSNGVSSNGVSSNGVSSNGVSSNGVSSNGHGGPRASSAKRPEGSSTLTLTRQWAQSAVDLAPHATTTAPQVTTMAELDGNEVSDGRGLLVVVTPLVSYESLRRVADLSGATGWPVVGVLSARRRDVRRSSCR
jgi:capsular polysaccharide biosynthesis protein